LYLNRNGDGRGFKEMARVKDTGVLAWLYMMRVSDKMDRLSHDNLLQFDLTPAQFDVLAHLIAAEGISQQTLSEKLFVTKGNVCGLIGRLEERGLVERRADPQDRRSNMLFLTPAGRELTERVVPAHEQFISERMSTLCREQLQQLKSLLRHMDKTMAE
jgi:DNA-binding MarR family transcriptional regulator